jgi:DMSO/TMAO reductase YedYZ molybdopterin-dependent catalytic subunit
MTGITRRQLIAGVSASSGLLVGGCSFADFTPYFGSLFDATAEATWRAQRAMLADQPLAREFGRRDITPAFPTVGTKMPKGTDYARHLASGFRDWRLPVTGLIERPGAFSLAELRALPPRTQITSHSCQEGWTAIGEWTGTPLIHLLQKVGLKPTARYVFFHAADGWYDSIDLLDAFHPQTILAYGMNGGPLPIPHGAPVRLRVERALGYKSLKFVNHIEVTATLAEVGNGLGSSGAAYGFAWNAGI